MDEIANFRLYASHRTLLHAAYSTLGIRLTISIQFAFFKGKATLSSSPLIPYSPSLSFAGILQSAGSTINLTDRVKIVILFAV
ncbi:hypothetical protein L1887_30035 [Cichorium endivia]|nr:hypothetical protein L1887_30035 [Cichorium endivia]